MEKREIINTKDLNIDEVFSKLSKFLCTIAGSNLQILSRCPYEINRHARIGAIIISTALLASLSMFFAIQTISKSILLGLFAGLVWGIVIFNLDSYIVASYKKNENKWTEFKIAIPRLILAIILGYSISLPLELKVFENEIQEEIITIKVERENKLKDEINKGYLKDIEKHVNAKKDLIAQNEKLYKRLDEYKNKVSILENELRDEIGGSGRTNKSGYGTTASNIDAQLSIARKEQQEQEEQITPLLINNRILIQSLDSIIASVTKKESKPIDLYGISAQLDGLKRLTDRNDYVWFAYWIFFLLILSIETAPIFVKLFTQKGSYDEILSMDEYLIALDQQKRKSDKHEAINTEIETSRSISNQKNNAQNEINAKLMNGIANAQGEIFDKAIQLWKYKQFLKIDENVDDFVKTDDTKDDN